MSKLILFGTYWNEEKWLDSSLKQIEAIAPDEVILCEGCFDLNENVKSSDNTRRILEDFSAKNDWVTIISPVRHGRLLGAIKLWFGNAKFNKIKCFSPARFKILVRAFLCHHYRINQALTFNKMISMSKYWEPGNWFMNYDADQFYDDEVIDKFKRLEDFEEYLFLSAKERTFFNTSFVYTDQYEKRNNNNMPHQILDETSIITTRDIVIENNFSFYHYPKKFKGAQVGYYNHYKFSTSERFSKGYTVGGRVKPEISDYVEKPYTNHHPLSVKKTIEKKI